MKKILTIITLLFVLTIQAQTNIDLSGMTQNMSLGTNCSDTQTQEHYTVISDLNLNNKTLILRNVKLEVTGNINGPGNIVNCGNSTSYVCLNGVIQNNPVIDVTILDCQTLSNIKFVFSNNENLPCKIYDLTGKLIHEGTIKDNFQLPKNEIFIIKTDKYVRKIIVN